MSFGLIFDMDGVIADTIEYHYRSWQQLADDEGVTFTREHNDALRGLSRRESLTRFLSGRQLSAEQEAELLERKNGYFLRAMEAFGPHEMLPGVADLLQEARAAGVPLGLASSSRNVHVVLERLELAGLFDAVADGNTVRNHKPAPDVFVWVAGRLGLRPEQCVVFEDAEAGVQAALDGGFQVVGLGPSALVGAAHRVLDGLHGARLSDFELPWRETFSPVR